MIDVLVQNLDVAVGFNHAAGHNAGLVGAQIERLGAFAGELERNLLEVQDDVGCIFNHAADGLELVEHAFDANGGDRGAFNGAEQGAAQGVADRGAKSALKGLGAELAKCVGERLGIDCQTLRLLKSSPKHIVFSFPARHVRRDAFCGGRASSPSVELQGQGLRDQGSDHDAVAGAISDSLIPNPYCPLYLLYSSTINCSLIGRLTSLRLGRASTRPVRVSKFISSHAGTGFCAAYCAPCSTIKQLLGALADGDFVADVHLVGRNVHLPAVDGDVAVANHLARLTPRDGKAKTESHVVQAPFELLNQQFAGDARGAVGLFVVLAELAFEGEVHALGLLLFVQLQAVAHNFGLAVFAVLAGSKIALFNWTAIGGAFGALQKELGAFATAKAADGSCITCHFFS